MYLSVLFKYLYENSRRQHTVFRILPARKSFKTDHSAALRGKYGLIEDLYMALFGRGVYIVHYIVSQAEIVFKSTVVYPERPVVMLLYAVAGKSRFVTGKARVVFFFVGDIRAAFQLQAYIALVFAQKVGNKPYFFLAALFACEYDKMIVGEAGKGIVESCREPFQKIVSAGKAVLIVVGLEVLYIHEQESYIRPVCGHIAEELVGLAPEIDHIVYTGKLVVYRDVTEVGIEILKPLVLESLRHCSAVAAYAAHNGGDPHDEHINLCSVRSTREPCIEGFHFFKLKIEYPV